MSIAAAHKSRSWYCIGRLNKICANHLEEFVFRWFESRSSSVFCSTHHLISLHHPSNHLEDFVLRWRASAIYAEHDQYSLLTMFTKSTETVHISQLSDKELSCFSENMVGVHYILGKNDVLILTLADAVSALSVTFPDGCDYNHSLDHYLRNSRIKIGFHLERLTSVVWPVGYPPLATRWIIFWKSMI